MENKLEVKKVWVAGQKKWQLISPVALALFLAACSSGIDTAPPALATTASASTRDQIGSTSNDVEESSSGSIVTGSSAKTLDFSSKGQKVGLRFSSLDVPQGAEITKAYVKFEAAETNSGSTTLTIRAHDTDSASSFRTSRRNVSSRSTTSASERWQPSSWRRGSTYQSDDLSNVIQEVVNRRGWDSGNALALIISGDNKNDRRAVASNRSRRNAPTLYVWYESSRGGGDSDDDDMPTAPSGNISSSQREWHKRLMASIKDPGYSSDLDPKKLAASGDVYRMGRNLNQHITVLSMAYRETGDRDIARQIDSLMSIAKGKLRDTNGDGYKNFRWLLKRDSAYGKDTHEMDEILAHSMIASAAYTLKQAGYSSSARFWTDYLENDFEAKWRKREGKRSGFPFMGKDLMHPYANFIRYHYYMYKLTGDNDYYSEAKRMVGVVKRNMRSSSDGYVWDHRVKLSGSASRGCQPMVYVRLSTMAFADLGSQGVFDSSFMKKVAKTMAYKGLRSSSSLAGNICGNGSYGSLNTISSHPYTALAAWDSSGKLKAAAERAYAATERRNLSSPRAANTPAIMVFTQGR